MSSTLTVEIFSIRIENVLCFIRGALWSPGSEFADCLPTLSPICVIFIDRYVVFVRMSIIPARLPPPTSHDGRFRRETGWLTFKEKASALPAQRATTILLHQRKTMRVVSQRWVCILIVRSWQKHFLMMLTHSKRSDLVKCLLGHDGINLSQPQISRTRLGRVQIQNISTLRGTMPP